MRLNPGSISILPPQKGLEILGRRGGLEEPKFKAMYQAKLEFPDWWGGGGGMDIFWNHTIQHVCYCGCFLVTWLLRLRAAPIFSQSVEREAKKILLHARHSTAKK